MSAFLRKLFEKYARQLIVSGGEGITKIPNKDRVRAMANSIYKDFKEAGVRDSMIKSEADVKFLHTKVNELYEANLARNLKDVLKPKKSADVLDLTGKKIDTSQPILGGKNVPESIDLSLVKQRGVHRGIGAGAQASAESSKRIKQGFSTQAKLNSWSQNQQWAKDFIGRQNAEFNSLNRVDQKEVLDLFEVQIKKHKPKEPKAYGGIAGMLGEPTYEDDNHRVPYGMGRRVFLKLMGGAAAGTAAAKSGLLSLFKSGATKSVIKDLTSVPIKAGVDGMPIWFKPLVNRVIKEGEDVTKSFSTMDRQLVHQSTLPNSKTPVTVTQDLTSGNVSVDIGMGKHGFAEGHLGQPVRLEYRAGEVLEPSISKTGKKVKATKTKEEFNVEEAEFTGGHPENIKFEESTIEKFGQHGSDFSEVEKFATGKVTKSSKIGNVGKATPDSSWTPDDFASGGRVPLAGGKVAELKKRFNLKTLNEINPSKKWDLKKAIEEFLKRNPQFKADGGIMRAGFFGGGAARKLWQKFIEKQFLKASNDIRQGKGIWQGLNQEQWITQHDNLTKKLMEWKKGGKKSLPPGMKEYFGMNDIQLAKAFKESQSKVKKSKVIDLDETNRIVDDLGGDKTDPFSKNFDWRAEMNLQTETAFAQEANQLKKEFPGISDDMINNILTDTNPQRIAEVKQTMREALKMQEKGMGHEEIINIFEKMKGRKPHATGGRVSLSAGGLAGLLGE